MKENSVKRGKKRSARVREFKRFLPLYIVALPGIIYLFINNYMPMVGLMLAFKKYSFAKGIFGSKWNGLSNFTYLFGSKWAGIMFKNTVCYNILFLAVNLLFSVSIAVFLSEVRKERTKKLYQTCILIPHLISMIIVSYLVVAFLSNTNGFINKRILEPLGKESVNWYTNAKPWPVILTVVEVWKTFGFQSIIYYATIVGFDKSYYEAAVVDGASASQQILRITLPLLRPTLVIMTLMGIGHMFNSDFGLFYQVPQHSGMLYSVTTTIDTYVYRTMMEDHDMGRSLAAGLLQSVLGFVLVLLANGIVRRIEEDSALF